MEIIQKETRGYSHVERKAHPLLILYNYKFQTCK